MEIGFDYGVLRTIHMKYSIACLAAIAIASSSFAVTLGTAPAVTIALTVSIENGGFKVVDPETKEVTYESEKITEGKPDKNGNVVTTTETKTVVQVVKFGNAQLLNDLLEDGSLPDETVKGWSIVSVSGLEDETSQLYAVKKGQEPVLIDNGTEEGVIYYETYVYAKAEKSTYSSADPDVVTMVSASATIKAVVGLSYDGFEIQGVETASAKYAKGNFGKGANAIPYDTTLPGAGKIAGISGNFTSDDDGSSAVVEGSFSIAASAVLDLETLGFSAQ